MGISRSIYYYKPKKGKKEDKKLTALAPDIALEHLYYGYRRVTEALKSEHG